MKFLLVFFLLIFSTGCDSRYEIVNSEGVSEGINRKVIAESAVYTDSFRIANVEIREEIIAKLTENNIQHWVTDDGSISYLLSDGKIIDRIGNEVILAYIRRN